MLDDLLALLGKASVSVVDGGDLTIKIRSATPSTEFRRAAVNAYLKAEYATKPYLIEGQPLIIFDVNFVAE